MHVIDVRLNGILTHPADVKANQLDAELMATLKSGPNLRHVSVDRADVSDSLLQELLSMRRPTM
jgi:hypothetical protein